MHPAILLTLTQNLALLIALIYVRQFALREIKKGTVGYQIISGLLFGLVCIAGMLAPHQVVPGLFFDGRTIVLSTAALFEGPIVAAAAAIVALMYRIPLGGPGVIVGIATIIEATLWGVGMFYLRRRYSPVMQFRYLLLFGFAVHVTMLGLLQLLPATAITAAFSDMALPLLIVYPVTTVIVARIFLDHEERSGHQNQIAVSEMKYRSLFENTHAVMLLIQPTTGAIIDANPAAAGFYGWSREELRRMNISQINTTPFEKLQNLMERASKGEQQEFSFTHRSSDGTERIVDVKSGLVLTGDETLLLSIIQDVTYKRQLEEEVLQALDLSRRAERMKDLFIATMSHEVRTPLNIIMGYTGLLSEVFSEAYSDESREIIDSITQSGHRLMRTIEMMLNFSSLTAGSYTPDFQEIDLCTLLRHATNDFAHIAETKGLLLRFERSDEDCIVLGDAYTIEQMVGNLLDNSLKFTQDGTITIQVHRRHDVVVLIIRDSGIGISPEYLPRIFTAFTQEQDGYTRPYEGLGLGLALVKRYVDLNSGVITVESGKGIGTTFTITFPAVGLGDRRRLTPGEDAAPSASIATITTEETP